jgi:hypothetical protein
MTDLSPTAQAVLDAFTEDNCFHDWKHNYYNIDALAAAIRAAVKQTRKRKAMKTFGVTMVKGPIYCLESDLIAIANELEAVFEAEFND